MLLIEIRRLKTEGVQIGMLSPSSARFLFGEHQKTMAIATASQFLFDPHQVDMEPVPMRCADHAADNFLVCCTQNKTQALAMIVSCLSDIVSVNGRPDDALFRWFDIVDAVSFIHDVFRFLAHALLLIL